MPFHKKGRKKEKEKNRVFIIDCFIGCALWTFFALKQGGHNWLFYWLYSFNLFCFTVHSLFTKIILDWKHLHQQIRAPKDKAGSPSLKCQWPFCLLSLYQCYLKVLSKGAKFLRQSIFLDLHHLVFCSPCRHPRKWPGHNRCASPVCQGPLCLPEQSHWQLLVQGKVLCTYNW